MPSQSALYEDTYITCDDCHPIKFIITPDQPQAVLEILQAKTQGVGQA